MTRKIYYHFTGDKLRDGSPIPPIGEWLRHDGPVVMCKSGLHASPTAFAALQYAPGPLLHRVYMKGDLIEEHDERECGKSVGRTRQIIATIDATDVMRQFARNVALKVIHLWDGPAIVREYLETGDESKRAAAWAAAWDAAQDAAWAAAWAAARDAAWAAAWDAAWAEYAALFNAIVDEAFTVQEAK